MEEKMFNELVESMKEGAEIIKGNREPCRKFDFPPSDIKEIRARTHKTQAEFSKMIGVSIKTLRNWEQGQRRPEGPAMALLKVVSKFPEIVEKALVE